MTELVTAPKIVKKYRLWRRYDDGSADYYCIDADGTELLSSALVSLRLAISSADFARTVRLVSSTRSTRPRNARGLSARVVMALHGTT
jgi:hypothetical protein